MNIENKRKAQRKYAAAKTKQISLQLNVNTDKDIIEALENEINKQGFIKAAIRDKLKDR